MTNQIYIGINRDIKLPDGGYLLIEDEARDIPRSRVFDPSIHSLNPLKDIDYKRARDLAEVIYTLYPQGGDTLTVRGGKRALARYFLLYASFEKIENRLHAKQRAYELDRKTNEPLSPTEFEVLGVVSDILLSPVLKKMLATSNFSFNPRSKIVARVNRAELGTFDALAVALLLINHFQGQFVIPDFGFYVRETHVSLLHQNRLIVGINFLSDLPPKLRQFALLNKTVPSGTSFSDAEQLAEVARIPRGTMGYNEFIDQAMAIRPVPPIAYIDRADIHAPTHAITRTQPKRPRVATEPHEPTPSDLTDL